MKPVIGRVQHRAQPKPPPAAPPPKAEPTGLPKPKVATKTEDPAVALAKAAVENYENQKRMLTEMKEDWEKNFPEANVAQQEILRQEDIVSEAISKAKPLVAAVKQTIGDFKATRKFDRAHYDETEILQILSTLEQRLEIFEEMLQSGIIESLSMNRDATIAWFAQRPAFSEPFSPAFKEEKEATCAVSVPKF